MVHGRRSRHGRRGRRGRRGRAVGAVGRSGGRTGPACKGWRQTPRRSRGGSLEVRGGRDIGLPGSGARTCPAVRVLCIGVIGTGDAGSDDVGSGDAGSGVIRTAGTCAFTTSRTAPPGPVSAGRARGRRRATRTAPLSGRAVSHRGRRLLLWAAGLAGRSGSRSHSRNRSRSRIPSRGSNSKPKAACGSAHTPSAD